MNHLWIPLALMLLYVQLPFGGFKSQKPEEKKTPVKGWWMVSQFAVPPTQYSRTGKGIIKAFSLGSRSALFKEIGEKDKNLPIVSWRWKISNVVHSAIETKKDRFDAAARVILVFGEERGFKIIEGAEPSGMKIEYIWASHLPKGQLFDHPGDKRCRVFVLESGEKKTGQWVYEKRNVHEDYRTAFGSAPPGLLAVGIETDTDHSNEMVTAYYSDPALKRQ